MKRKYRVRTVFHEEANGYKKEYFIEKRFPFLIFSYWMPISASCADGEKVHADCKEAQELYETQHDSVQTV
jgi:hypothetical protein